MNTIKLVGSTLYDLYSKNEVLNSIFNNLSFHLSDSIRCYAPYLKSLDTRLNLNDKLNQSEKLIADNHFGVREVVWMALRPEIDKNLEKSIEILSRWTKSENENIRRFTTESTRPRGVWCKHIEKLKENPEMALPILENLKSDKSKYVQNSVGNWLNDASKSKPNFVIELCKKWKKESPAKETEKIINAYAIPIKFLKYITKNNLIRILKKYLKLTNRNKKTSLYRLVFKFICLKPKRFAS